MSGIFRDSFQNVVELLDDCFQVCVARVKWNCVLKCESMFETAVHTRCCWAAASRCAWHQSAVCGGYAGAAGGYLHLVLYTIHVHRLPPSFRTSCPPPLLAACGRCQRAARAELHPQACAGHEGAGTVQPRGPTVLQPSWSVGAASIWRLLVCCRSVSQAPRASTAPSQPRCLALICLVRLPRALQATTAPW